jgi:hypothetical protein
LKNDRIWTEEPMAEHKSGEETERVFKCHSYLKTLNNILPRRSSRVTCQ